MSNNLSGVSPKRATRLHVTFYVVVGSVSVVTVFAIAAWKRAADPERMLKQAELLCQSDPIRGGALIDESIQAAGGRFTEAQLVKCCLLVKRGRISEAAATFSAISDWPENQRTKWIPRLKELVDVEYESVEEKLALEHCEKFALLVPESPTPWQISASILHMNGEPLRALEAYRKAYDCELPNLEKLRISYQIVTLALHAGDVAVARVQLDRLLKLHEVMKSSEEASKVSDADAQGFQVLHANVLFREHSVDRALNLLETALVKWPNSLGARNLRGTIYLDQGRFRDAIDDLTQVVNANPFETKAHYKLGQAYLALKDSERAQFHLDRSHELNALQMKILQLQEEYFNDPTNESRALQLAALCEQRGDQGLSNYWRRAAARAQFKSR